MRTLVNRLACLTSLLWAACSNDPAAHAVALHGDAVVYGDDDRLDVFEHPDPALRALARKSIVALMPTTAIAHSEAGPSLLTQNAEAYGLCSDERFADQPIVATCSGVLIADDLVLTAAHCVAEGGHEGVACDELSLVFDYYYTAQGELAALRDDSLYTCRTLAVQAYQTSGTPRSDYAVVQLDRPVSGKRKPVEISRRRLQDSEHLATLSFPIGLPLKIDSNAEVVDPRLDRGDYFRLKSDVFEGSSGGAVLNADAKLVGILSNGSIDFAATDAGCATSSVTPDDEHVLTLERASYAGPVLDALCDTGWNSPTLCAAATRQNPGCSFLRLEPASSPQYVLLTSVVAAAWVRRRRKNAPRWLRGGRVKS